MTDYCWLLSRCEELREYLQTRTRWRKRHCEELAQHETKLQALRQVLLAELDPYRGARVEWLQRALKWDRGVYAALRDLRHTGQARLDVERQMWFRVRHGQVARDAPLRVRVLTVLAMLSDADRLLAAEVAGRLDEDSISISAVLRHLHGASLVARTEDRRRVRWWITLKGRAYLESPDARKPVRDPPLEPWEVDALAVQLHELVETDGPATIRELATRLDRNVRHITQALLLGKRRGLVTNQGGKPPLWAPVGALLFPLSSAAAPAVAEPRERGGRRAVDDAPARRMA